MKWMLALCLCVGIGCQTTQSASMDPLPNWEYKVVSLFNSRRGVMAPEEKLNAVAGDGWEYVGKILEGKQILLRRRKPRHTTSRAVEPDRTSTEEVNEQELQAMLAWISGGEPLPEPGSGRAKWEYKYQRMDLHAKPTPSELRKDLVEHGWEHVQTYGLENVGLPNARPWSIFRRRKQNDKKRDEFKFPRYKR